MRRCCQGLGLPCLFKGTAASPQPRFLLVFDFDETLVDENSDDSVQRGRALPEPLRQGPAAGSSYNEHMRRVLEALGEQGVRPSELRAVYENLPLVPGVAELFQLLRKHRELLELVLISDANTFGIEAKLRAAGLEERRRQRRRFQRVFYVGDGANDFCPAGTLSENDVAFPRKGYPMHRLIQESQEKQPGAFRAAVVPWESGLDVARYLQEMFRGN